jgi:hypothetical protein
MRHIALVSLMALSGCGYHTWWNPPFSSGYLPNTPVATSVNMSRVKGRDVAVTPLTTQPGDIWPGPLPPPTTLQDLEKASPTGVEAPVPGSPLSRGALTAPLPHGAPNGARPGTPGSAPQGGSPGPSQAAPGQPQTDQRIIVPNGNGTSTVIYPDGRIETIPTPK